MTFFDTIKDEIKKEHENNSVIPKLDPKINPLLDKKKNTENIEPKKSTSLDFLKQEAERYSSQQSQTGDEKKPELEVSDTVAHERPTFERSVQPKPELPKPKLDNQVVDILREIRDQNREMISLLKEMKDSNKNSMQGSSSASFKEPTQESAPINAFSSPSDFSPAPSSERRFF